MTARFRITSSASPVHDLAPRRLPQRAHRETLLVTLCWLIALAGLAGSYWLAPLALQAVSCMAGLAGAIAALLLTIVTDR